jgi:hypothetical protein
LFSAIAHRSKPKLSQSHRYDFLKSSINMAMAALDLLPTESQEIVAAHLLTPADYQTCHICLPDEAQCLPAIAYNDQFYSFLRAVSEPAKLTTFVSRMVEAGEEIKITATPKSYVLWALEPMASLVQRQAMIQHSA